MPRKPSVYSTAKRWKVTTFGSAKQDRYLSKLKTARLGEHGHRRKGPLKATRGHRARLPARRLNDFVTTTSCPLQRFPRTDRNRPRSISNEASILQRRSRD